MWDVCVQLSLSDGRGIVNGEKQERVIVSLQSRALLFFGGGCRQRDDAPKGMFPYEEAGGSAVLAIFASRDKAGSMVSSLKS